MKRLSVVLSIILCAILAIGPLFVFKGMLFPEKHGEAIQRENLNTGNTIRIMGQTPLQVAVEVSKTLYPYKGAASRPNGVIILQSRDWRDALAILPLMHKYNSPIIPVEGSISPEVIEHIKRLGPTGIPQLNGINAIVIGKSAVKLEYSLNPARLFARYIFYRDTDELQKEVGTLPGMDNREEYGFIVSEAEPLYSIPISAWIAHSGGTILFIDGSGEFYKSSKELLLKKNFKKVYVFGNYNGEYEKFLKNNSVKFRKINAPNPELESIAVAKMYDPENGFGWDADTGRKDSGRNYILCSKDDPLISVLSSQLSIRGKSGPMLWTDNKGLSPEIENYLWSMKPVYWENPSEGPHNNVWIAGVGIDFNTQGRVDYIQEIQSYETMGNQAVSGLDAISILLVLSSVGGALWVSFHLFFRMRHLKILVKLMWVLSVLVLGPLGVWIYVVSYKDRPWNYSSGGVVWKRPLWNQAAVGDVMGVAFSSSVSAVIGFLASFIGLPLSTMWEPLGLFILGNPIILQTIISYIIAVITNIFIFMPAINIELKDETYDKALAESIPVVLISTTFLYIGMATSSYWLRMSYLPETPGKDNIIYWGILQVSSIIGFITAYIPNWWMVRHGKKIGTV